MSATAPDIDSLRIDLAAALRWSVRYNWHEAVANHFSVAVDAGGSRFLINPRQRHFARVRASDLLLIDAGDPSTMQRPDAPDPTAWGLHGALHRLLPHARCALHLHPKYATALACLADSRILPIDQNTVQFYNRVVIDEHYDGLAFEGEGERCAALFEDPSKKVMVMGNHGVLVIGETVGEAFDRLYYFERAAERMITAYMTGQPLRVMPHELAAKTARQLENYPGQSVRHFAELKALLDQEEPDYRH